MVLGRLVERTTARAVNTWKDLSHRYRLVWVIQEPAKQRARLKEALPSERELPPIDAIDIAGRVRNILTHAADELEREVCEKDLLRNQVPNSAQAKRFTTLADERERKEGAAQTPLDGRGSQTTDLDQTKESELADVKPRDIATDGGFAKHAAAEVVASHDTSPPILQDSESQTADPSEPKGARVTDEQRPGQASDDLGKNAVSMGAETVRSQVPLVESAKRPKKKRKGDSSLFNGEPAVSFQIAEAYLGFGERQRQKLVKSGVLVVEGTRAGRKITTASITAYLSPK